MPKRCDIENILIIGAGPQYHATDEEIQTEKEEIEKLIAECNNPLTKNETESWFR